MKLMSTGQPSTLGNYRIMCAAIFGEESKAVEFLDRKIEDSPNGEDEEVIADEGQMVHLLGQMHLEGEAGV